MQETRPATTSSGTPVRHSSGTPDPAQKPKLLDRLREALRSRHYSRRTEQTYCHWIKRFIFFHNKRHPAEMAEPEINAYLTHLAVKEKVSASTQNQALSALLFLYRHVLDREIGDLGEVIRARKPRHIPVVMTREEVKAVLGHLHGDKWLMANLMYGAGLRLMECLRLRVQDIEFARSEILIRDGKGAKDRITMLPESLKTLLQDHLKKVKALHERDLAEGWGRVEMPYALDRKYPNAAADWRWQWLFPQENRWKNTRTGQEGRHHVHETILQRVVREAVRHSNIVKHVGCHTFRHYAESRTMPSSFAGTPIHQAINALRTRHSLDSFGSTEIVVMLRNGGSCPVRVKPRLNLLKRPYANALGLFIPF